MVTKLQKLYFQLSEEHTIITALHQHKLHPLILSAKQLISVYNNITTTVPGHHFLTDFQLLGQTIEVDSVQIAKGFLVRISIPLTETESYSLNKIFLLPITIAETQVSLLDIESNYILNNTDNHHYIEFSEQEFEKNCRKYTGQAFVSVYICEQGRPKITSQNPQQCLTSLLTNPAKQSPICSHRILTTTADYITKLERKNSWLFNFQGPKTLTVHCLRKNHQFRLQGVGILSLKSPCSFLLGHLEIPYQRNYENHLPVHQPEVEKFPYLEVDKYLLETQSTNISNFLPNSTHIQLKAHNDYNKALRLSSKTIRDFEHEVSLRELERKTKTQNFHSYINSSVTITTLIIIVIVFSIKLFMRRRTRKREARSNSTNRNSSNSNSGERSPPISLELNTITQPPPVPTTTAIKHNCFNTQAPPVEIPIPPPLPKWQTPTLIKGEDHSKRNIPRQKSFRVKF